MKINYNAIALEARAQQEALDKFLREIAHNRGLEDKLVIKLYEMEECGYSYDQIIHTYAVGH